MNLIEKLEREHDDRELTCQDLFEDGHFDDKKTELLIQQTGVMAGLQLAIDIVKQHQAESGWVSVDERLPDESGKYWVLTDAKLVEESEYLCDEFICNKKVIAWHIYKPQPPSEVQDDLD